MKIETCFHEIAPTRRSWAKLRFTSLALASAVGGFMLLSGTASAATIQLFNTGVDASSALEPDDTAGDLHFDLIAAPAGVPLNAELVRRESGGFPISPGAWIGESGFIYPSEDSKLSAWIGPTDNSGSINHSLVGPAGVYTYQTTFILPLSYVPGTATINGRWAADDGGPGTLNQIRLNTVPVAGMPVFSYGTWTNFTIPVGNAFFVPGLNTVQFDVDNIGGSSTGLRVEWVGETVPEPSTAGLVAITLLGLCASRRSRQR